MNTRRDPKLMAALEANWQAEMEGHFTYQAFSGKESDPQRRNALRGLAAAEKHHAGLWAERIRTLGGTEPIYRGNDTGQAESLASRIGGADLALRRLEIEESRDIAKYGKQLAELGDKQSLAVLHEVIADEREHYRTLANLIRSRRPLPTLTPDQAKEALDDLLTPGGRDTRKLQVGWGMQSMASTMGLERSSASSLASLGPRSAIATSSSSPGWRA